MTFDRKEVSFSLDIVWQPLQFAGMFFPGHYLLQKDIVFVRMTNSGISCFNRDLVAQVPPIKKKIGRLFKHISSRTHAKANAKLWEAPKLGYSLMLYVKNPGLVYRHTVITDLWDAWFVRRSNWNMCACGHPNCHNSFDSYPDCIPLAC